MNRQTVGQRLDINMLRFQEHPMVPKRGYTKPKEVNIPAYSKPYAPPTAHAQLREQQRIDRMTANNRRTALNRMDRLNKLFKDKVEITGKEAMLTLDLASHRRGNEALKRLAKDGDIKLSRTENRTNYYVRAK